MYTISDDGDRTTGTVAADVPEVASENSGRRSIGYGISPSVDGGEEEDGAYHGMRSMILILALSLHHLFEGMSLGLQRTVAGVFTLLIALLCHETIISFSLGLQFVKCAYSRKQHYVTAFGCSIVEPIGVAVGMLASFCRFRANTLAIIRQIQSIFPEACLLIPVNILWVGLECTPCPKISDTPTDR